MKINYKNYKLEILNFGNNNLGLQIDFASYKNKHIDDLGLFRKIVNDKVVWYEDENSYEITIIEQKEIDHLISLYFKNPEALKALL